MNHFLRPTSIIAFDPGSCRAGYAVLSWDGRQLSRPHSGRLDFDTKIAFPQRLQEIALRARELAEQITLCPGYSLHVVLESLIYVKSPTSLMKLAQARAMLAAPFLTKDDSSVYEYAPNVVKKAITGHGHASKELIQLLLDPLLKQKTFESDDESDALAIAWCHYKHLLMPREKLPQRQKKKSGLRDAIRHKLR